MWLEAFDGFGESPVPLRLDGPDDVLCTRGCRGAHFANGAVEVPEDPADFFLERGQG
jgi:hypothetical protein